MTVFAGRAPGAGQVEPTNWEGLAARAAVQRRAKTGLIVGLSLSCLLMFFRTRFVFGRLLR